MEYANKRSLSGRVTRRFRNLNSFMESPWGLEDSWGEYACSGFVEEVDPGQRNYLPSYS